MKIGIGKWLKQIRAARSIKAKNIAAGINMDKSLYSKIENGRLPYSPGYQFCKKLRAYLSLNQAEWFDLLVASGRMSAYIAELAANEDWEKVSEFLAYVREQFPPRKEDLILEVYRIKRSIGGGKNFPWHATLHYECDAILDALDEPVFSINSDKEHSKAEKVYSLLARLSAIKKSLDLPEIEILEVING